MKTVLAILTLPILFFALLVGCGKPSIQRSKVIAPELQPYVDKFFEEAAFRGISQFPLELGNVSFVTPEKSISGPDSTALSAPDPSAPPPPPSVDLNSVGMCYFVRNDIEIRRDFFDYASEIQRELILFHELGHCVLGLQHVSGQTRALAPLGLEGFSFLDADNSMMAPLQSGAAYSIYRTQYLDAMFQNRNVDFVQAFRTAYPDRDRTLRSQLQAIETRINQIAGWVGYSRHIAAQVQPFTSTLAPGGEVFLVSNDALAQPAAAARDFYVAFKQSVLTADEGVKLENVLKDICTREPGSDLCPLVKTEKTPALNPALK